MWGRFGGNFSYFFSRSPHRCDAPNRPGKGRGGREIRKEGEEEEADAFIHMTF